MWLPSAEPALDTGIRGSGMAGVAADYNASRYVVSGGHPPYGYRPRMRPSIRGSGISQRTAGTAQSAKLSQGRKKLAAIPER